MEGSMADKWWYNSRTGETELGPQSNSIDRVGPFDTQAEAAHAPEKLRQNSEKWAAEDAADNR